MARKNSKAEPAAAEKKWRWEHDQPPRGLSRLVLAGDHRRLTPHITSYLDRTPTPAAVAISLDHDDALHLAQFLTDWATRPHYTVDNRGKIHAWRVVDPDGDTIAQFTYPAHAHHHADWLNEQDAR